MKKLMQIVCVSLLSFPLFAAESHTGHTGGSKSSGGETSMECQKGKMSDPNPGHLAEVAPGSEFSVRIFRMDNPKKIELSVKKIPVQFTVEDKDSFFVLHAKLPPELSNTVARVLVKMNNKNHKCTDEDGWLLKITP